MNDIETQDLCPVRQVPEKLQSYNVKLGYTGLMHYRNLGLVGDPMKVEGKKEKYYDLKGLSLRIKAINTLASLLNKSFVDIANIIKGIPDRTLSYLPYTCMRAVSSKVLPELRDLYKGGGKVKGSKNVLNQNAVEDFWKIVKKYKSQAKKTTPEKFNQMIFEDYMEAYAVQDNISGGDLSPWELMD